MALVGGNLSRGPLSITLQLAGLVPSGQALRRDGARPGDELYVSGTSAMLLPGASSARAGWRSSRRRPRRLICEQRFEYPSPRVALGQALRGLASACIDVSDGL